MKIIRFILLLLSFSLLSCESEPNIMNDDAPPALFVWGYVDMKSGKHQVRIRRAIQEEGNMYELAQDPELLLPADPLHVDLIVYSSVDDTIPTVVEMYPVIYPKEEGNFSSEQNIIHEVEYPIPEFSSCQVQVHNLATGEIITSGKVKTRAPDFIFPYHIGWYDLQFNFTNPDDPFHVTFLSSENYVLKLITEIKYLDILNNGDTLFQKSIFEGLPIFGLSNSIGYVKAYNKDFQLEYIFNILNRVIPDNPEVKYRMFHRFQFKVWAGSSGLRGYIQLAERHSDNRKLFYSNISGGYGLFYACDYSETNNIKPTPPFITAIWESPETENLKFSRQRYDGYYIDPDTANIQTPFNSAHHE